MSDTNTNSTGGPVLAPSARNEEVAQHRVEPRTNVALGREVGVGAQPAQHRLLREIFGFDIIAAPTPGATAQRG